ncbi:MAG: hypothetical protein JO189_00060 [Deltaproteobacteria bacterium]|nr:hypothetical protein [Deltaproteobacteria bacterium]
MEHYLQVELVLKALNMALEQRRPISVIYHSTRAASIPRSPPANVVKKLACDR